MTIDPTMLSATELVAFYAARSLSPVEVAQAALDRVSADNGNLNAFALVTADEAIASARASEARWLGGRPIGPLDGVPISIKDLMLMRGYPTLRGSRTVPLDQPWNEDAPVVARLREQGAVFVGKTTTSEFGWKGVTDSPLTGITRNPWDPSTTPGGSSGGAAVSVATGMATLAVGGDGGGSIRIPAAFTGTYGLKPTSARVPEYPAGPMGTLSHVGPMTRTVSDAALMLNAIARPDPRNWPELPPTAEDFTCGIEGEVAGLHIAFSPTLGYATVDSELDRVVRTAVGTFEALGAEVEELERVFPDPRSAHQILWKTGQARRFRLLGKTQRALLDPGLVEMAEEGMEIDLNSYLDAREQRTALGQQMRALMQRFDLLITPQMPITAFDAGVEVPPGSGFQRWIDWTPFTYPFNLTGNPAASVPCGFSAIGLPIALQIVGDRYDDALVLRASRAYEAANPFAMPLPRCPDDSVSPNLRRGPEG